MGADNPILSVHDVGAGGVSNAMPELAHSGGVGARFDLRQVPDRRTGHDPAEIWWNEAQERYVLAIPPNADRTISQALCERERCPFAVVGEGHRRRSPDRQRRPFRRSIRLTWTMEALLGKPPRMTRDVTTPAVQLVPSTRMLFELKEAGLPCDAFADRGRQDLPDSIGDRSVGGMTARDQMVGPWQVPVADVAVTADGLPGPPG